MCKIDIYDIIEILRYIGIVVLVLGGIGLFVYVCIQINSIVNYKSNSPKYDWIIDEHHHTNSYETEDGSDYEENIPDYMKSPEDKSKDTSIICESNGWKFLFWNGGKMECK